MQIGTSRAVVRQVAVVVALAAGLGCHGAAGPTSGPGHPGGDGGPALAGFPALRWVPAEPSYVLAGRTSRDLTTGLRELVDLAGTAGGFDVAQVSQSLRHTLDVDLLDVDALAAIGVDPGGGAVVFSTGLEPTVVVHLAAPDATAGFFDGLRQHGLVTQSIMVDGVEVFTAHLGGKDDVSWAVAGDWMWVHFGFGAAREAAWFGAGHPASSTAWATEWAWARGATDAPVVALVRPTPLRAALAAVGAPAGCLAVVAPVARIGGTLHAGGHADAGELRFELGAAAVLVAAAALPAPVGLAAAERDAALAVGWGLDVGAVSRLVAPCVPEVGAAIGELDRTGVRGGRAFLRTADPAALQGTGAVALALRDRRYFDAQLDALTGRSLFERDRTFGPLAGHRLAIPTIPEIDYVLDDHRALAGVGDGVLAEVVGDGREQPAPLAALTIRPPRLSAAAWEGLLKALDSGGDRRRYVARLLRWREGALALTLDGTTLVLAGHAERR
jgi:hypothetical protein